MTWVRLDDSFFMNAKTASASSPAKLLYLAGLCYCAAQLTDGFICDAVLPALCAQVQAKRPNAPELVSLGLWKQVEGGYQVPDYLDYNPARDQVLKRRDKDRERVNRFRSRPDGNGGSNGVGNGVTHALQTCSPYAPSNGAHVTSRNETSSSSSESDLQRPASRPEEDDEIHQEALRRLALRSNIANPALWLAKTEENLRAEHWKPPPKRALTPLPVLPPMPERHDAIARVRGLKAGFTMEDAG